jgi:hypothetical protein
MLTIGFVFWVHGEHERYAPFDEYKVLSILPNPKQPLYAAVVQHYHANSSATVIDVWIGDNPPPEIGSTERFHGWPIFIAPAGHDVDLAWRNGRLIAKVPAPVEIAGRDGDCFFNNDGIQDIACANLDEVDVLIMR